MRLSNFAISLLLAFTFISQGCGSGNGDANANSAAAPPESRIPFPNKGPENFSAVAAVTANGTERTYFIARRGNEQRIDLGRGGELELIVLKGTRSLVLSPRERVYFERASGEPAPLEDFVADMTTRLLHRREDSRYEELGRENGLLKYRVTIGDASDAEAIIYIDEQLAMPVIHEMYSVTGDDRVLKYRFELREISTEPDASLFALPEGYRAVSSNEFYRLLRKETAGQR